VLAKSKLGGPFPGVVVRILHTVIPSACIWLIIACNVAL